MFSWVYQHVIHRGTQTTGQGNNLFLWNRRTSVDLEFLSLLNESRAKIPSRFGLIHSPNKYLLSTRCMPGIIIGSDYKIQEIIVFYDTQELQGKDQCYSTEAHKQICSSSRPPIPTAPMVTCLAQMPREHPTGV